METETESYPLTQLNGGKIETGPGILCFTLKSDQVLESFSGLLVSHSCSFPPDIKYLRTAINISRDSSGTVEGFNHQDLDKL